MELSAAFAALLLCDKPRAGRFHPTVIPERLCLLCIEVHHPSPRGTTTAVADPLTSLRPLPLCPFAVNRNRPCNVKSELSGLLLVRPEA
jgi:hypothetical protein